MLSQNEIANFFASQLTEYTNRTANRTANESGNKSSSKKEGKKQDKDGKEGKEGKEGKDNKNTKDGKNRKDSKRNLRRKTPESDSDSEFDSDFEFDSDSDSDSDFETISSSDVSDTITDSDDFETVSGSDSDSDSGSGSESESETEEDDDEEDTVEEVKKSKKNKKYIIEDDEDEENDDTNKKSKKSKDATKLPHSFVQEIVSQLFPSKYMKEKVKNNKEEEKADKKTDKKTEKKAEKKAERKSDKKTDKKTDKKRVREEEEEEDSPAYNILVLGGDDDFEDEEYNEEADNSECDSDDEKQFMKEKYEKIDIIDGGKEKRNKKKVKKEKKDRKEKEELEAQENAETEYLQMVETKKHLVEQYKKKPKSTFLKKSIQNCDKEIKKLIRVARSKNTKKYHKMIHEGEQVQTNEIDYFRKKLSNAEQLRAMNDLKEINKHARIDKPYRLALLDTSIPPKYKATALQKLNMLRCMEPGDNEYYKLKAWVDTFMRIPFGIYNNLTIKIEDGIDKCQEFMEDSMATLDNCVYGLNDAKLQIMQLIGQWIVNPNALGTAIAIHGPPGSGKTSLIKDGISKILGREFAFITLGGAGDSSFLEGHSYTYEGSSWGKIIQILIDSKCMNPIIFFDELDKISDSARGQEITGILTHLTDTTQNGNFHDKYFSELDFDLSKCLFIFSYNDESKVNPILKDRMYRIQTKGYDVKEKVIIARDYLLPKIREQVKFSAEDVIIPDETLQYVINNKNITKQEEGVRNLKRCLEIIHTKLNLFRLVKAGSPSSILKREIKMEVKFPITITPAEVDILIKNEENQNHSMLAMYV